MPNNCDVDEENDKTRLYGAKKNQINIDTIKMQKGVDLGLMPNSNPNVSFYLFIKLCLGLLQHKT